MAQTKRKRRSKHRGNAAGMVEARGRTGRKPTVAETKKGAAKKPKVDRRDRVPSWSSAAKRATIAAAIFGFAIVVIFQRPIVSAVALAATMMIVYVPLTYYTDRIAYNRFQRKKTEARTAGKSG